MKNKILSMLDTTKKKVGAIVLCGVLIGSISVGTVYATNARTSLQSKMEDGVTSYSTDDGKTWSENTPDGVTESMTEDGKLIISNGTPPLDGEGKGLLSKVENGVRSYSSDGGETWSEKAPDGAEDSVTLGND